MREVEIRHVSHMLHPFAVQVGLVPAIQSLAAEFRSEFAVEVKCDEDLHDWDAPARNRIDPDIRLTAYRSIEEALVNASKHAQATEVTIGLSLANHQLRVSISDNGIGFDPSAATGNLGFNAIDARVKTTGGTWMVDSAVGQGTTVLITWPLTPPEDR